jgi:hypothetical protein
VLYSAVVSRRLHDGVHPVPVAFASDHAASFAVSLEDAPHVHVEIRGEDVSLFDMCEGMKMEQRSFDQIPDSWEDFISVHRTAPHLSSTLRSEGAALEFQESALLVGAQVTLVGELHRASDGTLTLRPKDGNGGGGDVPSHSRERWLTSWECGIPGCVGAAPDCSAPPGAPDLRIDKVLTSDDPKLFSGPLRDFGSRATRVCGHEALFEAFRHAAMASGGVSGVGVNGPIPAYGRDSSRLSKMA